MFANEFRINEVYALSPATRFNSISIVHYANAVAAVSGVAAAAAVAATDVGTEEDWEKEKDKNIKVLTRAHLFSVFSFVHYL